MGMAAILIYEPRPFVQIFNLPSTEGSRRNLKKTGPAVSEEKLFKGVDGRTTDGRTTDDGRRVIAIAHLQPSAELKQMVPDKIWSIRRKHFHLELKTPSERRLSKRCRNEIRISMVDCLHQE